MLLSLRASIPAVDRLEVSSEMHESIRIESLEKFLEHVSSDSMLIRRVAYRGQGKDDPLIPTLFRKGHACDLEGYNWRSYEQTVLRIFQSHGVSALACEPSNVTDWIVMAQHHGVPTRILDWSSSPLHALYFAVEECDETTDGVVWMNEFSRIRLQPYKNNSKLSEIETVQLYFPKHEDPRITAQNGCVTLHPLPADGSEFQPYVPSGGESSTPIKFIVPGCLKEKILFKLDDMGVNMHSIYPDLDGLGRYIKHRIRRRRFVNEWHTLTK